MKHMTANKNSNKRAISISHIKGQAQRMLAYFLVWVMIITMCQVPSIETYANPTNQEEVVSGNDVELDIQTVELEEAIETEIEEETEEDVFVESASETEFDLSADTSVDHVICKLQIAENGDITVVFEGSGNMKNLNNQADRPWFSQKEKVKKVIVQGTVGNIGSNAFHNCTGITQVQFLSTSDAFRVDSGAFAGCSNLTAVDLSGVKLDYIGQSAFTDCTRLVDVKLPENQHIELDANAFSACANLEEFTVPASTVVQFGEGVFKHCKNFKKLTIFNLDTQFDGEAIFLDGSIPDNTTINKKTIIACREGSIAYEFCQNHSDYAIAQLIDENGKSNIAMTEFYPEWDIEYSLVLDGDMIILNISGDGAMRNMSSTSQCPWYSIRDQISQVNITGSVSSIGANAFLMLENMTSFHLESDAEGVSIGDSAFAGCKKLESIDLSGVDITNICVLAFTCCEKLGNVILPELGDDEVLTIWGGAFEGCNSLTEFVIPVKTKAFIEAEAFRRCNGLKEVYAYNSQTSFGKNVFWNGESSDNKVNNKVTIYCQKDSVADGYCALNDFATAVYVDEEGNLVTLPKYKITFADTNGDIIKTVIYEEGSFIAEADVPTAEKEGFEFIGWEPSPINYKVTADTTFVAKYKRTNVSEFDISDAQGENEVLYELSEDGVLTISGTGAIKDFASEKACPWYPDINNIKSVIFTGAITRIGENICKGMKNLERVSFTGITKNFSIGKGAFEDTAMESLVLPANVGEVAHAAFRNTEKLKEVAIYGGTYKGNPFISTRDYAINPVFSFHRSGNIYLEEQSGAIFGQNSQGNMMNVVFDDANALSRFADKIYWLYVNDLYLPAPSIEQDIVYPSQKVNGCNVLYTADAGKAVITKIDVKGDWTEQLNLPEKLLNNLVTKVDCEVPAELAILHEGTPHQTENGVCQLCKRTQYRHRKSGDKYIIDQFDPDTDYYVIVMYDKLDSIQIFELAESFVLDAGKTLYIPAGYTLIVPSGKSFTIERGGHLILDGTMIVEQGATLSNYGFISGKGHLTGDGKFVTTPNEDTISFGEEEDFYEGNDGLYIIFIIPEDHINWWEVQFEVLYGEDAETYYEKFTGSSERQEWDERLWSKVSEKELLKHGVYRYVYIDPISKKKFIKRFVVRKPYGQATVSLEDWYYGGTPAVPRSSTTTNFTAPNVEATKYFYYKGIDEPNEAYQRTVPTKPGKYNIRVRYLATEQYQEAVQTATFEIKKRPIEVTIDSVSRKYGEENPASYTYRVTKGEFVGSDKLSDLQIAPFCMAGSSADVGTYPIQATVESDYYDVTIKSGNLTVLPITASLSVDPAFKTYHKVFGDSDFTLQGITKTGDGELVYAVENGSTDVVSVDTEGKVKILNAGEAKIKISLPDTENAKGASPVTVTVMVAKATSPTVSLNDIYYLRSKNNEIAIPLKDYLPNNCGNVDTSRFDANANVVYSAACDPTLFSGTLLIDDAAVLKATNSLVSEDCDVQIQVPVSMRNYEDTVVKLVLRFIGKQEVEIANGESVTLKKNTLNYPSPISTLSFADVTFVGKNTGKQVDGILRFKIPTLIPSVGSYDAEWEFVPDSSYSGLYEGTSGIVSVTVYQGDVTIKALPTTRKYVYDTSQTLKSIELIGGSTSVPGTWKWATEEENKIPDCENTGYGVVFVPSNPGYKSKTAQVVPVITPAEPTVENHPKFDPLDYKQMLKDVFGDDTDNEGDDVTYQATVKYRSKLDPSAVVYTIHGVFSWEDGTIVPKVSDSETTEYNMIFTPYDKNYKPITFAMTVKVNKLLDAPDYSDVLQTLNVPCTVKKVEQAKGLPVDWVFREEDLSKSISQNSTLRVFAEYNGEDKGCYENEEMEYKIVRADCDAAVTPVFSLPEDVKPTCVSEGNAHTVCKKCGDIVQRNVVVPKLGHDYDTPVYNWSISSNTVGTTATADFVCKRPGCSEAYENHLVTLPCEMESVTTDPLCTVDGKIDYTARVTFEKTTYEDKKSVPIEKLGHDMYRKSKDDPDKSFGYNWVQTGNKSYSCSVSYMCDRCHFTEVQALLVSYECTATCTEPGEDIYTVSANALYGEEALFDQQRSRVDPVGHKLFNYSIVKFATCTEKGKERKSCTFPGCTVYRDYPIAALGHKGGEATCSHQAVCTRCKKEYGQLNPSNHEMARIQMVGMQSQSCLLDGYSGDSKCLACDTVLKKGEILPMFGKHTWDNGVVLKEPTVLEKGQTRYTCKDCGISIIRVVYYDPKKDKPQDVEDDKKQDKYQLTEEEDKPGNVVVIYVKPVKPVSVVKIPSNVVIAGQNLKVTKIAEGAFKNDTKVTKVTIPANIGTIPKMCFSGAKNLKTVEVGSGVKSIEDQAFANCPKLTTVKLGKNVTSIGNKAFSKCPKLKSVTIPAKVTKLGTSLFVGDKGLKTIVIKSKNLTDRSIKKNAFKGVGQKVVVKVPKRKLKAYKKLFVKKGLSKKVKIVGM